MTYVYAGAADWGGKDHLRVLTAPPPAYPLCHLLLTAEAWARSLCQPRPHSAFLMPSTPRPATQKAAQTREAHLEAGLRPTALHLLPHCVEPQSAHQPTAHDRLGGGRSAQQRAEQGRRAFVQRPRDEQRPHCRFYAGAVLTANLM